MKMTVDRRFRLGPAGRVAAALNHLGGQRLFTWMLRSVMQAVEERASAPVAPLDVAEHPVENAAACKSAVTAS